MKPKPLSQIVDEHSEEGHWILPRSGSRIWQLFPQLEDSLRRDIPHESEPTRLRNRSSMVMDPAPNINGLLKRLTDPDPQAATKDLRQGLMWALSPGALDGIHGYSSR